jgi:glycosyltransferase involved in cell wall biosynthesis
MLGKNKILFISKESRGGMETFLNQFNYLDSRKFQKYFCFYKKDKLTKRKKNYMYFQNTPSTDIRLSVNKFTFFIKNISSTIHTLHIVNPHVVFALDIYTIILFTFLKLLRIYRGPLISIVNTNFPEIIKLKSEWYYRNTISFFVYLSTKYVDNFIFTSKNLAKDFIGRYKCPTNKTIFIPHSVDLKLISKLKVKKVNFHNKRILNDKTFKLFYVGRLDGQKDVSTILKAFASIQNKISNNTLFIIGDGQEKKLLIKESKKLHISNNVVFLGWQKNIYKYLKYADIFVFSSFYEGFAMVLVEAMALGIPIITTDTPFGPSEIVGQNSKYGYLVPVGDHCKMANKILKLSTSSSIRAKYSNLSLKRSKDFDVNKMITDYESVFVNLMK